MGLNVLGHSIYGIIILMMARPAVRIVDTLTLSFGDFRKQCNGNERPKLKDLYKHVTPCYAAHWEDIGVYLDIEIGHLKVIKRDNPGDTSGCCKDLWKKWLEADCDATWEKLFNAIDSAVPSTSTSMATKSHVDTFLVEYLRNNYIQTRYIPEGKEWPPNQPKYYINLAVIHYQGSQTQEELLFSANHYKHLDIVNDSERECSTHKSRFSSKFRITREIVDLFTMNQRKDKTETGDSTYFPKSILIEGAPGIGKTILLKEIAYCWASGTILDNVSVVFLVYLRDSRFQSVTTINEVIQYFDCLDKNEIPAVVKQLKQSNGEGVVFLIDGLDEYPGALQNSFLSRLIDRKTLSKCVYVITSRPCASVSLHNKVEQRIEILGFGEEERDEYISKFLKSCASSEKREELEMYFKQHPMLNCLVYIPFHLSVLLFLFQQGNLPETLTEMNESFILHTVYRHMEKHDIPTSCVAKLHNLPKFVYDIIYKLSKLAFRGLQMNQLVFTFDEIKQVCPEVDLVPGALNGFGLLQTVQHYPMKGAGVTFSFNFLHLTMQEFLAAWYISHCSIEEQKQSLKCLFMNLDELDSSNARMWQMFLGIIGTNCDAWLQFTTEYDLSLNQINDPLEYIYYFQCLLEGGSQNVCPISTVFVNQCVQFFSKTLTPYHIAMLCLFLSKSTEQWKHFVFCDNFIGDVGVKVLTNFLLANEKILSGIEVLNLSSNCLTSQSATAISSVIQKGNLTMLVLSCNDLGESGISEISQALKLNSTLKTLTVSLNDIGINGAISLALSLSHNHTLEHLYISNNKMMDDGIMAISECFKITSGNSLTCIKSLDISANCLTSHSSTAITTIIQEGALVSLILSYNKLGENGAYEISKALQTNLTLKQLFLSSNNIGVSGALSIAVALCHNCTLENLDISRNEILDDGAIAIAECLKTNKTLRSLSISHNDITEIGVIELVDVLKLNDVFKTLRIDEKCIEIFKPYNKSLIYNETVGRFYRIEVNSSVPTYPFDQDFPLVRVWINNISYMPVDSDELLI